MKLTKDQLDEALARSKVYISYFGGGDTELIARALLQLHEENEKLKAIAARSIDRTEEACNIGLEADQEVEELRKALDATANNNRKS